MRELIKSKWNSKIDFNSYSEYKESVDDLVKEPIVHSMKKFIQHSDISCFSHCISVSYYSYILCKFLNLDYRAAARGGLLHDFFLYDWHISKPKNGMHGFTHPHTALENSNKYFILNDIEKDIIEKHMWPLTLKLPKYKEAFIVSFVDKYCALMESIKLNNREKLCSIEEYLTSLDNQ